MRTLIFRRMIPAVLVVTGLAGCGDARRKAIADYFAANPPPNLAVASVDPAYAIVTIDATHARAGAPVTFRVMRDTVEMVDGFQTTIGAPLAARMDGVMKWAAAELPKDDAARKAIVELWSQARRPLALKRWVVRAGDEVTAQPALALEKPGRAWVVRETSPPPRVGGILDDWPEVPVQGSEEARAVFGERASAALKLDAMRREWIDSGEQRAARSLEALRARLRTGNTFSGVVRDRAGGAPVGGEVRLVISRGLDRGDSVIGVIKDWRREQSSVRYEGGLRRRPEGEFVWAASRTAVIALAAGAEAFFEADGGGDLVFEATASGLASEAAASGGTRMEFDAKGRVDLIPEP